MYLCRIPHYKFMTSFLLVFVYVNGAEKANTKRGNSRSLSPHLTLLPIQSQVTQNTSWDCWLQWWASSECVCRNCRRFQKNEPSPTTWNCQQTVQTGLIFSPLLPKETCFHQRNSHFLLPGNLYHSTASPLSGSMQSDWSQQASKWKKSTNKTRKRQAHDKVRLCENRNFSVVVNLYCWNLIRSDCQNLLLWCFQEPTAIISCRHVERGMALCQQSRFLFFLTGSCVFFLHRLRWFANLLTPCRQKSVPRSASAILGANVKQWVIGSPTVPCKFGVKDNCNEVANSIWQ